MRISVQRARRLGSSIENMLKDIVSTDLNAHYRSRTGDVQPYIYQDIEEAQEKGSQSLLSKELIYTELNGASFDLRLIIGNFNSDPEVSALQNELARTKALLKGLQSLVKDISPAKHSTANNLFAEGASDEFIKTKKTEVLKLSNKVLELTDQASAINIKNNIVLPQTLVDVLQKHGLLD